MTTLRISPTPGFALLLGGSLALSGCVAGEGPVTQSEAEDIIGGFPGTSPQLDAVGALGIEVPEGFDAEQSGDLPEDLAERSYLHPKMAPNSGDEYLTFCTGTLLEPDTVLTAEHCVDDLRGDEKFLIGFDGTQPERAIAITDVMAEDTVGGGAIGFGSDVAIAFLAEEVEDVELAEVGTLDEQDVGTNFVNVGYGVQNNDGDSGTRFLGAVTLRGLDGNMADHLFGDFEGFLENVHELGVPEDITEEELEDLYHQLELLDDYEATFGHAEGNAQSCYGDSGGPVMRQDSGGLTVYGVTSWGLGSEDLMCDWGGAYATLGPSVLELVERAEACPGIPSEGMCDGDVATRCAPPEEGGWRPVETDCGTVGMICGEDEDQEITCVEDACAGIPEEGMCDGDTVVRCTEENEGERRVVETDCSTLGMTCGDVNTGELSCVAP